MTCLSSNVGISIIDLDIGVKVACLANKLPAISSVDPSPLGPKKNCRWRPSNDRGFTDGKSTLSCYFLHVDMVPGTMGIGTPARSSVLVTDAGQSSHGTRRV